MKPADFPIVGGGDSCTAYRGQRAAMARLLGRAWLAATLLTAGYPTPAKTAEGLAPGATRR